MMITNDKKVNIFFLYWLTTCLILVFSIIIIGGLTRLTNSGLSITQWELFKGILPPLNESTWIDYFNEYKEEIKDEIADEVAISAIYLLNNKEKTNNYLPKQPSQWALNRKK